ncbi:MAG: PPOX class F420-dependent oxidoreductase [Solirubrobacterales bacterium]|nr:PPOX class F420-dependent oxidoreductase [Solirubrobacterales bacterium]
MSSIPADALYLLEGKHFAHVATINPDGSPQVTPVWIDHDGDMILFNTAKGRIKDRNLRHDPRVAISIPDSENPYQALVIQGRVKEITEEGADQHIDALAKRYLDQDVYPFRRPGEVRLKVLIESEKAAFGLG